MEKVHPEDKLPVPWIGLGLCSIAFFSLAYLFVHPPNWLDAQPIPWTEMITFAGIWAIASALPIVWGVRLFPLHVAMLAPKLLFEAIMLARLL